MTAWVSAGISAWIANAETDRPRTKNALKNTTKQFLIDSLPPF
jgi:hypothetical protein